MTKQLDCIVAAGGVPQPNDPLYDYTLGKPKALLEINGRLMIEYVLDALQQATTVNHIVVVGLEPNAVSQTAKNITYLPNQGSLLGNGLAGVKWLRENRRLTGPVLLSSSDIPALTAPIVDHFVASCVPFKNSIYYNFITRQTLEIRYPHSKRTYIKLKGLEIAGGYLLLVQSELGESHADLWEALINGRKHAWKLARLVGWRTLIKLLTRQLSIDDIEAITERILGKKGKIILNPHAEIGMDVDKKEQLEILIEDLSKT